MYSFNERVRYSEIDSSEQLSIGSVLDYFQDCSTFQSEHIGLGLDYLGKAKRAWLLNSWQIVLVKRPRMGEAITLSTWPYQFDQLFAYRNFTMEDANGEICAYANSVWFYINTETMRPVAAAEDEYLPYGNGDPYPMNYESRKIAVPNNMQTVDTIIIRSYQIDTNHHMNNAWYVKLALDYLPADFEVQQIRTEYRKELTLGDSVRIDVLAAKENYYVALYKDNKISAIVEFRKDVD